MAGCERYDEFPRTFVVGSLPLTLNSGGFLQSDQPTLWFNHRILLSAIVP